MRSRSAVDVFPRHVVLQIVADDHEIIGGPAGDQYSVGLRGAEPVGGTDLIVQDLKASDAGSDQDARVRSRQGARVPGDGGILYRNVGRSRIQPDSRLTVVVDPRVRDAEPVD